MRKAAGYMNYSGRVEFKLGEPRGPNYMGEIMHVVSVDYDEATNSSRVGWAYGLADPEETKAYYDNLQALPQMQ